VTGGYCFVQTLAVYIVKSTIRQKEALRNKKRTAENKKMQRDTFQKRKKVKIPLPKCPSKEP